MLNPTGSPAESMAPNSGSGQRYTLWIDGVGAYLVYLSESVTIGGPMHSASGADLCLFANLSRRHATLRRSSGGYWLEAHSAVRVAGRPVEERTHLNDGYEIELADRVRLQFRLPSVLSSTAVIEFISDHRPSHSVDGVLLVDDTCLLGPGVDNHVRCHTWAETVLLYRKDDQFWCKAHSDLFIDGKPAPCGGPIRPGAVVSGIDLSFRLEPSRACES